MDQNMDRTQRAWRDVGIATVILSIAAPRVVAQTSTDTTRVNAALSDSALAWELGYRKSEKTAVILGMLVPGAGHLYAGEWWKSYALFVGTSGAVAMGSVIYQWPRCGFNFLATDCSVSPAARVLGATVVTATLAAWAMSAVDAGEAVDRQRARRASDARRRRDAALPIIAPCGVGERTWCVGVSIPLR